MRTAGSAKGSDDVGLLGTTAFWLRHGVSAADAAEATVEGAMVDGARPTGLLTDRRKFGREAVFRFADLDVSDVLVADDVTSEPKRAVPITAAAIEVMRG